MKFINLGERIILEIHFCFLKNEIAMKRAMSKSFSHSRMIIGEFHVAIKKHL